MNKVRLNKDEELKITLVRPHRINFKYKDCYFSLQNNEECSECNIDIRVLKGGNWYYLNTIGFMDISKLDLLYTNNNKKIKSKKVVYSHINKKTFIEKIKKIIDKAVKCQLKGGIFMIDYTGEIKKMNLWEKIAQISSEVQYLQKDDNVGYGKNSYKAISIEKVMTAVSDKMAKYGIVIYPVEQIYNRKDEEVTKVDGSKAFNRISDVDVKYQVINIHNPSEQFITVSSGTGVDTQDKGIGKAMTYAYKNMIIKLFAIATGDDTDKVHSDDYTDKLMGRAEKKTAQQNSNLSDKQLSRLFAIGKSKGINQATITAQCVKEFGVSDISQMTKEQYDNICSRLEKVQK